MFFPYSPLSTPWSEATYTSAGGTAAGSPGVMLRRSGYMAYVTGESATSEPAVVVREAALEDDEALHALTLELADALGDRTPPLEAVRARLSELLEEPRARVLVAEAGGAVAGAASLWIKPDLAHGDTVVEVPMLVVSGDARLQGVGRLLVEAIRSVVAAEGATLIELVATRENEAARAFYRALGFIETTHIALEYVGDGQDPE